MMASPDTKKTGKKICHFKELGSTNDKAKELALRGAEDGTVVVAEMQKSGRGRLGRTWISPQGGVYLSIILRPARDAPCLGYAQLTLMGAVAVARAIKKLYGLDARIKWPNDVMLDGKKVCGIVAEASAESGRTGFVIIGIGINADTEPKEFPEELRSTATSLCCYVKVSKEELIRVLLEEFDLLYSGGFDMKLWRKLSDTLGKNVRVETLREVFSGRALDVDEDGALLVEKENGTLQKVVAGDVVHLK